MDVNDTRVEGVMGIHKVMFNDFSKHYDLVYFEKHMVDNIALKFLEKPK